MGLFSSYLETLCRVNDLEKSLKIDWLFYTGMLFNSRDKWWGDFKFRATAHEGIDISFYRTQAGEIKCFDNSIKVPAMDDGKIVNICDDFLGQTLVVKHKAPAYSDRQIFFIYAHIIPEKQLKTDRIIKKKEVIAKVCDTNRNRLLTPHLHFSCIETQLDIQPEELNWKLFSKNRDINLIHPVFL